MDLKIIINTAIAVAIGVVLGSLLQGLISKDYDGE